MMDEAGRYFYAKGTGEGFIDGLNYMASINNRRCGNDHTPTDTDRVSSETCIT